jgi:hypothetical protein
MTRTAAGIPKTCASPFSGWKGRMLLRGFLLSSLIMILAGCGDSFDVRDFSALHDVGLIDLDGDSNNDNGLDLPTRSAYEDSIEDVFGSRDKTVVVPLNSADSDDTINAAERFVPLVVELSPLVDVSNATIRIVCDPVKHGSGKVRLWVKPSHEPRNTADLSAGGDSVSGVGEYSCAELGFADNTRRVVLYAEGVSTSTDWGDVLTTVLLDPDGGGPEDYAAVDYVRLSVIDAEWTIYLVLPYTFETINNVDMRTFTHVDFSSPRAYKASVVRGLQLDDPLSSDEGWHGGAGAGFLSANMYGHSFTHLRYVGPGGNIDSYYGKTDVGFLKVIGDMMNGNMQWANEQGRRNDRPELMQWVNNTHMISSVQGGPADLPLVQHHKWILNSLPAIDRLKALSEPKSVSNPDGADYDNFGFDIYATGGGCTYLSGAVMERVAKDLGGFGEQAAWRSSLIWPIIPLDISSLSGASATYDANPLSRSWGKKEVAGQYRRATYFDTGLMGDWMLSHPGDSVYAPPSR